MGFILLTSGLLLIFIALVVLADKKGWNEAVAFFSLLTAVIVFALGVEVALIINLQVKFEIDYNQTLYEKEVLEFRLENDGLQGNELLYQDITKFNNNLRNIKYWHNNPWVNWFYNDKIASIDYVKLE